MYLFYLIVFVLGLSIGSFINALIYRLHTGKSILKRSICPKCCRQLKWYDNIPLISFFFLKGKCRFCGKKISIMYPVVEAVTALLFVFSFVYRTGSSFNVLYDSAVILTIFRDWILIFFLVSIFLYDLKWFIIPDTLSLGGIALLFLFNYFLGFDLWKMLFSGIIGGGFFLVQFIISRGKWIGGGDIRLGFLMGIALSFPGIILGLFLAYILGSAVSVPLVIFKKKKMDSQIPFGIYLTSAALFSHFFGGVIINWYLSLL